MTSTGVRGDLTEANLRRLQPSLIQPMPPVSISSGDDDSNGTAKPAADAAAAVREPPAARVARLKTWVYNAMLTLAGLGHEGATILAEDELYIAGPGDVRLRPMGPSVARAKLKREGKIEDGDEYYADGREPPDLSDPEYWQAKLRYLESKCMPLSQERRKRRRLAPESQIAAEDAARADAEARAAEGGAGFATQPTQDEAAAEPSAADLQRQQEERQAREEARAERERIEQSKLLWREKRGRIDRWVQALTPPSLTRCVGGGCAWLGAGVPPHAAPFAGDIGGPPLPKIIDVADMSDSSIVEITPAQFSNTPEQRPRPSQQQQQQQQQSRSQKRRRAQESEAEDEVDDDGMYDGEVRYDAEEGDEDEEDYSDDDDDYDEDGENGEVMDTLHDLMEKMTEAIGQRILEASQDAEQTQAADMEIAKAKALTATEDIMRRNRELEEKEKRLKQQQEQEAQNLLKPQPQPQPAPVAADTSLDLSTTATVLQTSATATPAVDTPITSASPGERTHTDENWEQRPLTKKQSPVWAKPEAAGDSKNPTPVLGKRQRDEADVEGNSAKR
ncbi:hypothetical protein SEUCBS140593_008694 [Sporothrix eucalyptigena]|uniref:Uncharacterized protein n=1 Tax=Sporothrix eucalyptigena TaxID=1812306 RepID=A0ABP0CQ57_9PEZI